MSFAGFPTSKAAGSSTTAVKPSPRTRLTPESYKLVWVCSAPTSELAAAKLLLDEEHEPPIPTDPKDENTYAFGKISGHNIIIAKFPSSPTNTAAASVRLRWKFKGVTSAVVVGIAGAAPGGGAGKPDLRLGDIVVGIIPPAPGGKPAGGLKPYDSRRVLTDGPIHPECTKLPSPAQQTAVLAVKNNHSQNRIGYTTHLTGLISRDQSFKRPGPETDILFGPSVAHVPSATENTCAQCPQAGKIARAARQGTVVHYGIIAGGGAEVYDTANRDAWSAKCGGALCFETEAAGVVGSFPCLVIRGLANYADTHGYKNKTWNKYAAAAAAAYAKELLAVLPQ